MKDRVAVFVDWQNLYAGISATLPRFPGGASSSGGPIPSAPSFDSNVIPHLSYFFHSFLLTTEELFRIFLYTALPMTSAEVESYIDRSKNYSPEEKSQFKSYWTSQHWKGGTPKARQDKTYEAAREFQTNIMRSNYYALRLGQQRCQNLEGSGRPNLVQKQLDMLIGIDISHVSFHKQVDKIMLFSKDTDTAPALKVARVAGLQTIIASIQETGYPDIRLQKHADFIRSQRMEDINASGRNDGWDVRKMKRRAEF